MFPRIFRKTWIYHRNTAKWVLSGDTLFANPDDPGPDTAPNLSSWDMANSSELVNGEKVIRPLWASIGISGAQEDERPFTIWNPGYIHSAASRFNTHSITQYGGHLVGGPISVMARPEHIRLNHMWILNPTMLSCLPSTIITPIPTFLMSFLPLQDLMSRLAVNDSTNFGEAMESVPVEPEEANFAQFDVQRNLVLESWSDKIPDISAKLEVFEVQKEIWDAKQKTNEKKGHISGPRTKKKFMVEVPNLGERGLFVVDAYNRSEAETSVRLSMKNEFGTNVKVSPAREVKI